MKSRNILVPILCLSMILFACSYVSAQQQIGFKITEDCITECAAPVSIKGTVTVTDAGGKKCMVVFDQPYYQNYTYWVTFVTLDDCEPGFTGPQGWVDILIRFYNTDGELCCEYPFSDHWTQWGETFNIDMN